MVKRYLIFASFVFSVCLAHAQTPERDTIPPVIDDDLALDSTIDYDQLLSELDLFLDSILSPRSYVLANISATRGYFNFINRSHRIEAKQKYIWSPAIGYYSKKGPGLAVTASMVDDGNNLNFYQYSISPSYDYLTDRRLATGISYIRYFTKDSLPFYTSPLQNEVFGYFLWRKSWLQPAFTANYGWGSSTEYRKRDIIYRRLVANSVIKRLRDLLVTDTATIIRKNTSSIVDFTVTGSVRHDFYWLNIFSGNDYIRFTPLVSLTAGTQKFGYNQTTATSGGVSRINLQYNTGSRNISLEDKFKLLSASLYLRSEYTVGKFLFQPQVVVDYYFPAKEDRLNVFFSINAGFMF